jgi:uncharacterized protein YecE (DUF72 family)
MAGQRKIVSPSDGTLPLFDTARETTDVPSVEHPVAIPDLRIGTSSFTAAGWSGPFYPPELKPKEYLTYYATKFNTVEVDSTFYATPSVSTVNGWRDKTPEGFIIAAKVPQVITHEKALLDCEPEFEEFVDTMRLLGDKLGPLVLQFPYFNEVDLSAEDFLARLRPFLERLQSTTVRFAIEIRNKAWLNQEFANLLGQHRVALVLQDQEWMPRPDQLKFDCATTDFAYIRLLGDRKGIERQTKVWDKVIVDRSAELQGWVSFCQQTVRRGISTYVYVNNHYSGHAPATVAQFLELWDSKI